jgi:transcriptional adapter 3
MVPILSQYASPPPIRSVLFKNPPDAVPPTDDLNILHEELKMLKHKTLERAKKAGEDLRTIEESMMRMKEREKGKGKAVDKAATERECGLFFTLTRFYMQLMAA